MLTGALDTPEKAICKERGGSSCPPIGDLRAEPHLTGERLDGATLPGEVVALVTTGLACGACHPLRGDCEATGVEHIEDAGGVLVE